MTTTRFGDKLSSVLSRYGITLQQFGSKAGISHPTVIKLRSYGIRPSEEMLRKVCNNAAVSRVDGAEILCEHLRDEIARAGFLQDEVNVVATGAVREKVGDVDRDLDILREASIREDFRLLLHDLAVVFTSLRHSHAPPMLKVAAEPRDLYHAPKRKKK